MYKKQDYTKTVFVSDVHAPFHDKLAVKACLSFVRWWKPDQIVFMGDLVDFYAISRFNRDPERRFKLQEEIDAGVEVLESFCKASPNSKKIFLRGNHEHRFQKYFWSVAPEAASLRSNDIVVQLKLKEMDIDYIEDGKMKMKETVIKHGNIVRKFSAYTAKGEFESCGVSGVSAHTHRLGRYFHTHEGGSFTWMETGCLCDLSPEYMEGKVANWQQGFGIGFYKNSGSKRFNINLIPIVKGKAMWGGYEFY